MGCCRKINFFKKNLVCTLTRVGNKKRAIDRVIPSLHLIFTRDTLLYKNEFVGDNF